MSENIVLKGNLEFMSLADVFQILGSNAATGVLKIKSRHVPHEGSICFLKGNPVNAFYETKTGIKAVYKMFGWADGEYSFCREDVTGISRTIEKSRMEVVLDALRMLDDGEIEKVGHQSFPSIEAQNSKKMLDGRTVPALKGPFNDYLHVVREDVFRDGEEIVKEGSHGKWLWTIYEGRVRVTKKTENGSILLSRLGEGCLIGTIKALLFGDYERNATVTAEGDVRLCLLDAEPFYREYAALSREFRKVLISLDGRLRRLNERVMDMYLKKKGNLQGFPAPGKARPFKPDNDLYTIVEGNAGIVSRGPAGEMPILALNRNDVFGNIPFMDIGHEPTSAFVLQSGNMRVEKMNTGSIEEEYEGLSPTFKNLVFNLGSCITMTTSMVHQYNKNN